MSRSFVHPYFLIAVRSSHFCDKVRHANTTAVSGFLLLLQLLLQCLLQGRDFLPSWAIRACSAKRRRIVRAGNTCSTSQRLRDVSAGAAASAGGVLHGLSAYPQTMGMSRLHAGPSRANHRVRKKQAKALTQRMAQTGKRGQKQCKARARSHFRGPPEN